MQRITRQIKTYSLTLVKQPTSLKITARRSIDNFILEATLTNETLPNTCINLFDNVGDIYEYLEKCDAINIVIAGTNMTIVVIAIGKLKEISIPMEMKKISREEILEKKVEHLQLYTLDLQKRLFQLEKVVKNMKTVEKKPTPPAKEIKEIKEIKEVKEVKMPKEIKKAKDAFQKLEQTHMEIASSARTELPSSNNSSHFSKLLSQVAGTMSSMKSRPPVITFPFQIDQTSKFIECFTISRNTITLNRNDDQIYMISSTQPIPSTRRHSISFKINRITDGLIWVGIFVEGKKLDQYIGEQLGIMMFALDGKKMIVESKTHKLQLPQYKTGSIVKMEIDIPQRKFRIFTDEKKQATLKVTIPQSMFKEKLYPFVQFISKDDSVTILE